MQTEAHELAKHFAETGHPQRMTWRMFDLQVTDLEASVHFWTAALGLQVRSQSATTAVLGTQTRPLVTLHAGATRPVEPGYRGMYHLAIGVADQVEFSRLLNRFIALRVPMSPVDHLMSKSVYLADPDGLEIEFALEVPERLGAFGDERKGAVMYDAEGRPHSGRERLDLEAELAHAKGTDLSAPLAEDTVLSHLHLRVAQLEPAVSWFEDIGFTRNLVLNGMGLADMGTGGPYTHRIAMNIWSGPNAQEVPDDMARLLHYTLDVHDPDILAKARGLTPTDGGLTGIDPAGVEARLLAAA